jgi:IclR family acetate operon transcriptional repressor
MPPENRSLTKALALIEALGSSPRPQTAVELTRALKLTRPTVYRILKTLAQHGFITREEGQPSYRLSFKLLDLGQRVLEGTDLFDVARPVLRKLGARCHETVHLAVPEDGRMVYLDKLEGSGPFCTNSRLGKSVPMHCTALGKSILAFLPPLKARAVLMHHGTPRHTPRTIVALPAMEREFARVRRQGYAIDDVEFEEGVRCVGAPIFDHRGIPIAAISVSAPLSRMPLSRAHEVGAMVREEVAGISRAMGWGSGAGRDPAAVVPVRAAESFARRSPGLGRPPIPRERSERAPQQAKGVIGRR